MLKRQASVATAGGIIGSDTSTCYTVSTSASGSVADGASSAVKYPYVLQLHLISGKSLVVRDENGLSDPYVKLKLGRKLVGRSRVVYKTLDPEWDEEFSLKIRDVELDLELRVYDKDRLRDDYMGHCFVQLCHLCVGEKQEFCVDLTDETGKAEEPYMGTLTFSAKLVHTLIPEESLQSAEVPAAGTQMTLAAAGSAAASAAAASASNFVSRLAGSKRQHNAIVIVHLVDGRGLLAMDDTGVSDPYVKFRLGEQKYKSRVVKETLTPHWGEEFEMRLFPDEEQVMHISVFDYDVAGQNDFMGRTQLHLRRLAWEKSHVIEAQLLDGAGSLRLLITITGATISSVSSVSFFSERGRQEIMSRYAISKTHEDVGDVGWLQVKVLRAERLLDDNHKVDAFCIVELGNTRLQTHTEYKTSTPSWERTFVFDVRDIHSWLEVWVYDENKDRKSHSRCLGRVAIRPLRSRNGERRWHALRDKNLECKMTGVIQLETELVYNPVRAVLRTLNPPEPKLTRPVPKFKLALVRRNVNRFVTIVDALIDFGGFVESCWQWENPVRTCVAFICYMTLVWNFEVHMIPFTLAVFLVTSLAYRLLESHFQPSVSRDDNSSAAVDASGGVSDISDSSDVERESSEQEDLSWRKKIQAAHGILIKVQEGLDLVASMCESVRHTFDWTEPWLSALALLILLIATMLLYCFPIRFLALVWGLNKFTKKILRPNAIDNNELLDFLSRVPSDVDLAQTKELRVGSGGSGSGSSPKKSA